MPEIQQPQHLQLQLQHKEDQLALAIHLANANAVPLCSEMIKLLTEFLRQKLSGDLTISGRGQFQEWIEQMTRARLKEREE